MRIADTMVFEQTRENLNKNRTQMSDLQNQSATQKRVTKPSDDPIAAARVLKARVDLTGQVQFTKNLNYAKSFLEFTDQSLGELTDLMVRAKELALGQASDASANAQSRRVVGTEVKQLFSQAVNIGNRKLGDRFIFGGYRTVQTPFNADGAYRGDDGEMSIHVDKDSFVTMNMPGSKVFLGEGLSSDGVAHATQKQPKTIEDFKAQKQALRDEENKLNDESVELRGPASLRTPDIEPSNPEAFEESIATVPLDAGRNLFTVLRNLEISLMANDKAGVQDSIEEIDRAVDQVVLSRSQVGARVNALENTFESLQKAKVDGHGVVSQLEDADIYKLVSEISKTENALQATMSTSGKIMQKSLLDFLS